MLKNVECFLVHQVIKKCFASKNQCKEETPTQYPLGYGITALYELLT